MNWLPAARYDALIHKRFAVERKIVDANEPMTKT